MAHDVFISYSHNDKAIADAICNALENEGTRCWYAPRDIEPGAEWASSIVTAIKASKVMVLIFTKDSNISKQVLREVSNAVSAGLTIIPLKLTGNELTEGMQYYLSAVHWLDALDCQLENAIQNVVNKVQAILASGQAGRPNDNPVNKFKRTRKLIIAVVAIVLAIVGFLVGSGILGGLTTDPDVAVANATDARLSIEHPELTFTDGNLQCNMVNGGIAASDDNYFYYRSNDGYKLYRMRKDGSEQELLLDEQVMYLSVNDGFIYYYSQTGKPYIGRLEIGTNEKSVIYTGQVENIRLCGDTIYFNNSTDSLLLYSISINGTDLKCVNEVPNLYNYLIGDDCIYYINHEDGDKLYKMSMDGSKYQKLTDYKCANIILCEDCLVYCNIRDNTLNALDLKSYDEYTICNGLYNYLTLSSYGITGVYQVGELKTYKISLNKMTPETLISTSIQECCQVDGFLFYRSKADGKYHATAMNGGKTIEL